MFALVLVQWALFARAVRGAALVEKGKEYVEAAACLGLSKARILFGHLLPNCLPPLIVIGTLQVANAISAEATLSFLGIGLPITEPSLGLLIANGYEVLMSGQYWISVYPGLLLRPPRLQHQYRRRSPARGAEPAARAMRDSVDERVQPSRSRTSTRISSPRRASSKRWTASASRSRRGEVLGLVGESGSGKSITGFSILGLVDPPGRVVGGRILFQGQDLVGLSAAGDAQSARPADRDDLSGSDDDAQPGAEHRARRWSKRSWRTRR